MRDFIKKVPTSSIVLTILAILFAVWGGYQFTLGRQADIYKDAVKIEDGRYLGENEGEYVCVSGKPVSENELEDTLTGVKTDGFILIRNVEMYQYYTDGDKVYKDFLPNQMENIEGDGGEKYTNPAFPSELHSVEIIGDAHIGEYKINRRFLATLAEENDFFPDTKFTWELKTEFPEFKNGCGLKSVENGYSNVEGGNPKIGDIMITYEYIPADTFSTLSLFGLQKDGFIGTDNENDKCFMAYTAEKAAKGIDTAYGSYSSAARGMFIITFILIAAAVIVFFAKNKKLNSAGMRMLSVICVICLTLSFSIKAFADFGDFAGDSDFGGGWDSGSDYDYDYDNDYDYDDDDDNYYNDNDDDDDYESSYNPYYQYAGFTDGGGSTGGGLMIISAAGEALKIAPILFGSSPDDDRGTGIVGFTMLACIVAIVVVVLKRRKSSYSGYSPKRAVLNNAGAQPTDQSTLKDIGAFKDIDTNFSEAEFCSDISNMYVKFQNAWQDKNIEELRPYLTDEFYARIDRQLDAYRKNHQTNMIERIAVLGTDIKGWKREKDNDVIIVRLRTRIVDYVVDDKTQQVVRGSRTAEKFMEYEWSLSRKSGIKTGVDSGIRVVDCPNCGAPLNISKTAKCEYCGSIVTVDSTDWVVTEMKGISQRTNGR